MFFARFLPLVAIIAVTGILSGSNAYAKDCEYGATYVGPAPLPGLALQSIRATKIDTSVAVSAKLSDALLAKFKETVALTSATEASVSVYSQRHGFWSHDYSSKPALPKSERRFWLASIGKLATAVIIGQLMEEKQLLPNDTLERWFPDLPNASLITIEQLLTHTSGLKNFNQIESVIRKTGYKTPQSLLATVAAQRPDFCPGSDWYYSNTGYLVLALIAEQLDEQPYPEIIERRIAKPLGLSNFTVVQARDKLDSVVLPNDIDGREFIAEIAGIHGAGSIASSTDDVLKFLAAYLRGELINDTLLNDSLSTLYPLFSDVMGYGRGIMVSRVPDAEQPSIWVGHSGGSGNGKALIIFDLEREAYVAVALNTTSPAEAIANALLKVMGQHLQ